MVEHRRLYKRNDCFINITYTWDDEPWIGGPDQALPITPQMLFGRRMCGASIKNSCSDGFCFYTENPLEPGNIVTVKMIDFHPFVLGSHALEKCMAKVRWCRKNEHAQRMNCFEVGVQKIQEQKRPMINFKSTHFGSMKCV